MHMNQTWQRSIFVFNDKLSQSDKVAQEKTMGLELKELTWIRYFINILLSKIQSGPPQIEGEYWSYLDI